MANNKGAIPKCRTKKGKKGNKSSMKPTGEEDVSIHLCQICLVEDGMEKICCDTCMLWYHFVCAAITSDIMNQESWTCSNCVTGVEQNNPSKANEGDKIDIESENPSGYSKLPPQQDPVFDEPAPKENIRSRKAHSSVSSVSRRAALALQKLDEERKMSEARDIEARERDKQFLSRKYAILEDDGMSNLSFDDEELDPLKIDSVKRWAEDARLQNKNVINEPEVPRINSKEPNQRGDTLVAKSNWFHKIFDDVPTNRAKHESSTVAQQQKNLIEVDVHAPVTSSAHQEVKQSNGMFGEMFDRLGTRSDELIDEMIVGINSNPMPSTNRRIEKLPDWLTKPKMNSQGDNHHRFSLPASQPIKSSSHIHPVESTVPNMSTECFSKVTNLHSKLAADLNEFHDNLLFSQDHPQRIRPMFPPLNPFGAEGPRERERIALPQDRQENQASSTLPVHKSTASETVIEYPAAYNRIQWNIPRSQNPKSQNDADSIYESAIRSNQYSGATCIPTTNQELFNTVVQPNSGLSYQQSLPPIISNDQASGWTSNYQTGGFNQPECLGSYQSRNLNGQTSESTFIMSNGQPMGTSQSQPWVYQPLASSHQNHGSPFVSTSHIQSFGTSNPFGVGQTFNTGQPVSINQPYVSNMSTSGYQHYTPISNINYVPVSQSIPLSQSMIANNGNHQSYANGSMMAQNIIPARLTAEQIAARHVMPRDLPKFTGDPSEWETFISAYDNSIEACGFTNSENLGRLLKCLDGDAKIAVKSRLVHKNAVPGVIHTLRMMYGRPELIIEKMIQDIQKLPSPKDDDLPALIKYAISVQNLSSSIQNLGAIEHLRNPTLINQIVDKLPSQHQLNWAFQKRAIGNVHIGHLGDWLYNIADVASQVVRLPSKSTVKKSEQKDNKHKSDSSKSNPFLNTQVEKASSNNFSNNNHAKSEVKKSCPACHSNKCTKLVNCKKFKDATRTERWNIVKNGSLCGRCFGPHKYYRCETNQSCSVEGCNSNHHTLLHNYESSSEGSSNVGRKSSGAKSNSSEPEKKTCNSQRSKFNQRTDKFRIVPVMLHFKGKSVRDYAYLDDGSNMTTIEESLADELELTGSSKELCVDWAFGQTHSVENSRIVAFKISGYYENAPRFNLTNVRTVNHLHLPIQSVTTSWVNQYPHFKNVPIATYESVKPRLLIGLQFSKLIVSLETIEGGENEPIVCKTRLGWVVQGPTFAADSSSNKPTFSMNMCVCQSNDNELHQLVKNYFAMEHIGIKIPENTLESTELRRAKQILDSTTIKTGDRYEIGHGDILEIFYINES